HLYSLDGGGQIVYVYIFSTIAVLILLIACINFMNLATARSGSRAKEVGMRKVIGAVKKDITIQFFGESLLLTLIALVFAVILVMLALPGFNSLAGKQLSMNVVDNRSIFGGLFILALFTGLIAGSYPALFLSSFQPVKVIKGIIGTGTKNPVLRRILVVAQFSATIVLIIGTTVIYRQIDFIRNKDLGFDQDNIIILGMNNEIRSSYESFKNEILQNSNIINVSASNNAPMSVGNINPVYWEGKGPDNYVTLNFASVDYDYLKTFDMDLAYGRDFSREFTTDAQNYIINEAALKLTGLEDPIGKMFSIWTREGKIIGVVKDFHSQSLHNEISPVVITLGANWPWQNIFIKLDQDDISESLSYLKEVWNRFSPGYPFEYRFMDEQILAQYTDEDKIGEIFGYFTFLAILISCLGLFGLASYMAEQRTKEIGIRKVLGATVSLIIRLLSKEFLILIILSNIIAWPASYIAMTNMLNDYAYRTNMPIWIFFASGIVTLGIALLTVSFQALKAALTNPVQALKYE
ncbi:FtsX-like permease family protein, partial [candidate division KSB1 bacterium]